MEEAGLSKSVQRAIDVLELVAAQHGDLGVTEIAKAVRLPKSTTHRLLANLEARGLIEQDPVTERYRVGLRLFTMGANAVDRTNERASLRGRAHGYLEQLVVRVGETGYVGILDRGEVLYIDSVEGPRAMRAAAPTGTRRGVHCTAVGKVLIAEWEPADIDRVVGTTAMASRTARTVTDPGQFRSNLKQVRTDGYALDISEYEEGLACMAAPIRGGDGRTVAAIGLTGPAWRLVDDRLSAVLADLRATALAISAEMGHRITNAADLVAGPLTVVAPTVTQHQRR